MSSVELFADEARPETAPLHNRFEWDDELAGEAYRRVQASELIRSVKIQYAVVQDELATKILLKQLEREIGDLKRKFGHLKEFADLMRTAAEAS